MLRLALGIRGHGWLQKFFGSIKERLLRHLGKLAKAEVFTFF
jgi:hypothetical protein